MNTIRLLACCTLAAVAQGATAATIWLKDDQDKVCTNSLSVTAANPDGIIGLGGVSRSGDLTFKITNPEGGTLNPSTGECAKLPKTSTNPIVFTGTVATDIKRVRMLKPGTNNVPECLDQGENFVGIRTVQDLWDTQNQYVLQFTTGFQDGCQANNPLPIINRNARVGTPGEGDSPFLWLYQGKYHLFNENSVPEPGSLLLLGAGAAGLMAATWLARRRRMKA